MTRQLPTALIAEDEPLLRESLERLLLQAWPTLRIVARTRNGRETVNQFEIHTPDVCFLDLHMPGMSGIEAARHIGRRAHLVFVTAFDHYAVQAFAQGVLDYLVKPVELARLVETAQRVQERIRQAQPVLDPDTLLQELAARFERRPPDTTLRWIRASVGATVTMIAVTDIDFLRAEEKYTVVARRDETHQSREAVLRTPLKDLVPQLDPGQFTQIHRAVVVNLRSIARVVRGPNETAAIHLKGRAEVLPVSRTYLPLFKQM